MGPCCVDGCTDVQEDTVYFEFPASRALRKRWMDVLKITNKLPLGSVVCSLHFNKESYENVRGKVRLKSKVVPTLHLNSKSSIESTPDTTEKITEISVLPVENIHENGDPPQPDSTTDNIRISDGIDNHMDASDDDSHAGSIIDEAIRGKSPKICEFNSARTSVRSSVNQAPLLPDPKQPPDFEEMITKHPPDFEDMITNYQIKNSKPNALMRKEIEIEIPPMCERDEAIVLDGEEDAPPVFIEINVDKETNTTNEGAEDCLMVLESVQCDIDPTALILPEPDLEEEPVPEVDLSGPDKSPERKEDPISLLTSSDESDVILQEPEIDTVEVSDETDEDDMPLVKLLKKKPKKQNKRDTKAGKIDTLMWGRGYDFYCMACHFNTSDSAIYNLHVAEHNKVLQVCSLCNFTTSSKKQFARHTRKHKEEKRYKCHLCKYRARHKMALTYHLESHKRKEKKFVKVVKKGFKCKKCGFKSETEEMVLEHVRSCGIVNNMYSCDLCSYENENKQELKRHWRTVHEERDDDSEGSYHEWKDVE